mgnify:CR=1 FL=1
MSIENTEFRPKIVAFCCNWCSYAGADLAGSSRLVYPADVKIIRVPCSCRVNPMFILRAFEKVRTALSCVDAIRETAITVQVIIMQEDV